MFVVFFPLFNDKSLYDSWFASESKKPINMVGDTDAEAYIPVEYPDGFYGVSDYLQVNWSYWKHWLNDMFDWRLQASNDNVSWVDANQLLSINCNFNESNHSAKITLTLDTTDAPKALYYRFDLACNKTLKDYAEINGDEWALTLPANDTEDYIVCFNWSDIHDLIVSGKVWYSRGVKDNFFWFRIQSVNKINVGVVFVIDPSFSVGATGAAIDYSTAYTNGRKIAVDSNGTMYCVYYNADNDIQCAKSTDLGATWSITEISGNAGKAEITTQNQYRPSIAIDSNDEIHVVWEGTHAGSTSYTQIRYSNSSDSGATWASATNLTAESVNQEYASIAIDSNDKLHVVWDGPYTDVGINQPRYINSSDGGYTWSGISNLYVTSSYGQYFACIAIDSNDKLHVAWYGRYSGSTSNNQILYCNSSNSGLTWSAYSAVTSGSMYAQYNPTIAVDSTNKLHIVWTGYYASSTSKYQIRYSNSTNSGVSWSAPSTVSTDTVNTYTQNRPSITIDSSDYLHVIWHGTNAGSTTLNQIRCGNSTNSGITWSTPFNITNNKTDDQLYPNSLWANYPLVSSVRKNVPLSGFCFIWADTEADLVMFYKTSDFALQSAAPDGDTWQPVFSFNSSFSNSSWVWKPVFSFNSSFSNSSFIWKPVYSFNSSFSNTSSTSSVFSFNSSFSNTSIKSYESTFSFNSSFSNSTWIWKPSFSFNSSFSNSTWIWKPGFSFNSSFSNASFICKPVFSFNSSFSNTSNINPIFIFNSSFSNTSSTSSVFSYNSSFSNTSGKEYQPLFNFNSSFSNTTRTTGFNFNCSFGNSTIDFITISDEYPGNNSHSIPLQPYLLVNISSILGNLMNISWYYGISLDSCNTLLGYDVNVSNGTVNELNYNATIRNHNYYWRVMVNDGTNYVNETYTFKTEYQTGGYLLRKNEGIIFAILGLIGLFGIIGYLIRKKRK